MTFPKILGHGSARIIEDLGLGSENHDLEIADRVLLSYKNSATCPSCKAEQPARCETYVSHNIIGETESVQLEDFITAAASFFSQSSFRPPALTNTPASLFAPTKSRPTKI